MAKASKTKIDKVLLKQIVDATKADGFVYLSAIDGNQFLQHNPPLIVVNTSMADPSDPAKFAVKSTADAATFLDAPVSNEAQATSPYEVITGAVLPASKRGNKGGGAPTVYPFDKLEIGQTFFVPVSEKHPDPVKTLGSTVSSANMRFAKPTGETVKKERTKRGQGNKAVLDAAGNKVKEMVDVPVYKYERKFSIRPVKAGVDYGTWKAPSDGALIARIAVD